MSNTESASSPAVAASTRERLEQKKKTHPEAKRLSFPQRTRGLVDALVFAYLLAMFIRTYAFELFMIPTGSMTPTLIGDSSREVVLTDYDGDGVKDVVYTMARHFRGPRQVLQIYLMNADNTYKDLIFLDNVDQQLVRQLDRESDGRTDMIIVNKFAYWFKTPERGEIAVFKVPYRPSRNPQWEVDKPVYIKRVIGLPGEEVTIRPTDIEILGPGDPNRYGERFGGNEIHLQPRTILFDGKPLDDESLAGLIHFSRPTSIVPLPTDPPNVEEVPKDGVLMMGDNSYSSSDGRYWGYVPLNHMRGKAIFRYVPFYAAGFLDGREKNPTPPRKQTAAE